MKDNILKIFLELAKFKNILMNIYYAIDNYLDNNLY
jgi:hypothetical protein